MQRELSGGLILRSLSEGHASDRERLPQFYVQMFSAGNNPEEEKLMAFWTQELMDGHPTVTGDDIFVVVDPAKDDLIVSATLLIPQVWRYEDVEFTVGRPELVATHPDYRRRGLVRALFDAVHERSGNLGHNVLVITGIPYFYRQFGYTMAVDLGQHATMNSALIKKPENLSFTLRLATDDDIPDMIAWADAFAKERLLSTVYTEQQWRYELSGRHEKSPWNQIHMIIVNEAGEGVGFVSMRPTSFHNQITSMAYVVGEKSSYFETFNDVIYAMKQWGEERYGEPKAIVDFNTGGHDTLSMLIDRTYGGHVRTREYAYYLRIVDLPRFIREITPVLERRLEGSGANRYTGTLKIGFYDKTGLTIEFEKGRLKDVNIGSMDENDADISFPHHLLLNVIFGYTSHDELRSIMPEVWANLKAAVLLSILFPKKRSWLLPIV